MTRDILLVRINVLRIRLKKFIILVQVNIINHKGQIHLDVLLIIKPHLNIHIHIYQNNKHYWVLVNINKKMKIIKDIQLGNNKEINQRIIKSQGQVLIMLIILKN